MQFLHWSHHFMLTDSGLILYQSLKTKSHTYLLSLSVRLSQCQQRYQYPGIQPKLTFVNCFRQLYSVKYSVEIKFLSNHSDQSLNSTWIQYAFEPIMLIKGHSRKISYISGTIVWKHSADEKRTFPTIALNDKARLKFRLLAFHRKLFKIKITSLTYSLCLPYVL